MKPVSDSCSTSPELESLWPDIYVESDQVAARALALEPRQQQPDDLALALFLQAYHVARRAPAAVAEAEFLALQSRLPETADPSWASLFNDARAYLCLRLGRRGEALAWVNTPDDPAAAACRPPQHRCVSHNIRGHLEFRVGSFTECLRQRYLHLHAAREGRLRHEEAVAWTNIAESHVALFNLDDALPAQRAAFELWCELLHPKVRAVAAANLMWLHCLQDQPQAAAAVLARWRAQPGGIPESEAGLFASNLVLTLTLNGQLAEAQALIERGFIGADYLPMREARWTHAVAQCCLHMHRPARAREAIEGFLARVGEEPQVTAADRVWLHELLARACEAQGDLAAALVATRQAQQLTLTLLGSSASAHVLGVRWSERPPEPQVSKTDQGRLATIDQAVQAHVQSAPGATPSASAARTASALDVARISHDMRSPLSGVLGLTSMLLMSDLDERQRQLASLTRSSAESLLVMVNDIVDLARSEQGRLDARLSRVDLWALVQEQVELCRLHVGSRPLGVLLHLAPDVPRWIETDGDKLRRVLHNYLSNALKFSRRGDITVCVEAITQAPAHGLRIDVRDNGAGIAEADQPGIFGEFYQAGAGVAQAGASSGLGLAVARRLIEALGGEVGFESTLGQGSRFWFIVPLRPA